MSIFGILARPLVVTPIIMDSADALNHPKEHVAMARPALQKLEKHGLPPVLDADITTATRITAVASMAAGVAYAVGRKPRMSALFLTAVHIPTMLVQNPIWEAKTTAERKKHIGGLLRKTASIAGILAAASLARK